MRPIRRGPTVYLCSSRLCTVVSSASPDDYCHSLWQRPAWSGLISGSLWRTSEQLGIHVSDSSRLTSSSFRRATFWRATKCRPISTNTCISLYSTCKCEKKTIFQMQGLSNHAQTCNKSNRREWVLKCYAAKHIQVVAVSDKVIRWRLLLHRFVNDGYLLRSLAFVKNFRVLSAGASKTVLD